MDLLVHVATAHAPARLGLRDGRVRALLYAGVCLPDILYKGLLYIVRSASWVAEPTHSPLGLAAWCYLLALLFEEAWRGRAFWTLWIGGLLHLATDAAKNYMGHGVIHWGFPFTLDRVELGWLPTEEMWILTAPAAALMVAVELAARLLRRR